MDPTFWVRVPTKLNCFQERELHETGLLTDSREPSAENSVTAASGGTVRNPMRGGGGSSGVERSRSSRGLIESRTRRTRVSSASRVSGGVYVKAHEQVWSLTQFYSVFHNQGSALKKCVFNKRTIQVCVSCCWQCPGISAHSTAHLTVSLYLCSSGSNAWGESRAREGCRVSSKSPSRVRDGDEGVAGRNGRE